MIYYLSEIQLFLGILDCIWQPWVESIFAIFLTPQERDTFAATRWAGRISMRPLFVINHSWSHEEQQKLHRPGTMLNPGNL